MGSGDSLHGPAHREEFQEFVISQSDKAYRPILHRLYVMWEKYAKYLLAEESMIPPYIMLASPSLHSISEIILQ